MAFDKNLLNKVKTLKGMHKKSYVAPPPPQAGPPMGGPPPGPGGPPMPAGPGGPPPVPPSPGDATGGQMANDPQQLVQMAADALSQGVDPNQLMQMFQQQGVPPEIGGQAIEQAMAMLQGPPPQQQGAQSQQPIDISKMVDEKVKSEMASKNLDPESRLSMLEAKINTLTEVVENMVNGLPPKTAGDRNYYESMMEALEYGDYMEI